MNRNGWYVYLKQIGADKATCDLCGFQTHRVRHSRLTHDRKIYRGYPRLRLTIDERYRLREGNITVCAERRACELRQRKQMSRAARPATTAQEKEKK